MCRFAFPIPSLRAKHRCLYSVAEWSYRLQYPVASPLEVHQSFYVATRSSHNAQIATNADCRTGQGFCCYVQSLCNSHDTLVSTAGVRRANIRMLWKGRHVCRGKRAPLAGCSTHLSFFSQRKHLTCVRVSRDETVNRTVPAVSMPP